MAAPVTASYEALATGGAEAPRWLKPTLLASVLIAFYLVTSIYISAHRLFWFDELFTVLVSRLPNASTILDALNHADNNMPAPYFFVVHLFQKWIAPMEVAARLPSALAMAAGLWIVFDCVRRLTDGLHGLIAVAFLSCTLLPRYGYEARSYGIYFMFVALAFWIWSHTRDDRKWGGILFGCAIFGGLLFHYYTVLCLVPFGLCEAFEWRPWRRPSAKLIGAVVAVAVATAVLAKQMFGANRYSATFWSKPSLYGLRMAFPELFPNGLFVVVAIIALLAFLPRKNAPMSRAERAGWFCLLIPFTGYILALVVTNAFVTRYFLGMVPGVAIAFACFIWRNFRYRRAVAGGAFAVLAAAGAYEQMTVVRHPESIDPFGQQTQTRQMLKLEETLRAEGKHVFLCSTGLLYMEVDYYSKHPEQYRLLVPSEKDLEVLNTVRYTLAMGRYYPFRFWSPEDLKQHARETALIQPSETTLQVLQGLGLQTRVRYKAPLEVAYLE